MKLLLLAASIIIALAWLTGCSQFSEVGISASFGEGKQVATLRWVGRFRDAKEVNPVALPTLYHQGQTIKP